ncbi:hypothetical protein N9Y42_05185 [Mariniblastus sp.]|nr:hypothetical protein [Mariniblastus sp.]
MAKKPGKLSVAGDRAGPRSEGLKVALGAIADAVERWLNDLTPTLAGFN